MAVGADAEELEVDATRGRDRLLVGRALPGQVGRVAVGPAHVVGIEVDPADEIPVDHRSVALVVPARESDVLVE